MFKTILGFIEGGVKNVLHVENIPIVGDAIEEIKSKDGGAGKFTQVNMIRLLRKVARILLILAAAYLIIKGSDEKAEKIQQLGKQIEYVS